MNTRTMTRVLKVRTRGSLAIGLASSFCLALSLQAGVKTWTGNNLLSHNWSASNNWDPAGAPQNGDDLIFPDPDIALKEVNTNNLVNLRVRSITFQGNNAGYQLWGNGITISNSLNAGHTLGINTLQLDTITLGGSLEFRTTSLLTINSDVALNGFNLTVNTPAAASDFLFMNGVISGTGSLRKIGLGVLQLGGTSANTYAGLTEVNAGQLTLSKPDGVQAVPDSLLVGDGVGSGDKVLWLHDNQIGSPGNVELKNGASIELNGHDEGIGSLTMDGGTVASGTGILTLGGNIAVDNTSIVSSISGTLSLGLLPRTVDVKPFGGSIGLQLPARIIGGIISPLTAGLTFQGGGIAVLSGTNTYRGVTRVLAGRVIGTSDAAFGTPEGGVEVASGAILGLETANIGAEPLTLNGSGAIGTRVLGSFGNCSWGGPITINGDLTIFSAIGRLNLSGAVGGTGRIIFEGDTIRLSGPSPNTYTGATRLNSGILELGKTAGVTAIPGDLSIGGGGSADTVKYLTSFQLPTSSDVTILSSGVLDLNNFQDTIGALTMQGGRVETGVGQLRLGGNLTSLPASTTAQINGNLALTLLRTVNVVGGSAGPCDLEINAVVVDGGIVKQGNGTLCLNANNTFTGNVRVEAGEIRINADQALGTSAGNTEVLENATLFVGIGANTVAEPLRLAGSGIGGTNGALRYSGGVTWVTNILLNAPSSIASDSDPSLLEIKAAIQGSGDLTKLGGGTLKLSGNTPNTFAGDLIAVNGKLELGKTIGVAVPRNLILGTIPSLFSSTSATGRNLANAQIASAVTVRGGSVYDLNGFSETISSLLLQGGGDVVLGTGELTVAGSIQSIPSGLLLGGSSSIGPAAGKLNLSAGEHTISVQEGTLILPDGADLTITAAVVGPGGIVKEGNGDLLLSGANTYAGETVINAGELWISSPLALGSFAAGTRVQGDGVLGIFDNTSTFEPLTLDSVGTTSLGAIHNMSGTNSLLGTIQMLKGSRFDVEAGGSLRIFSGISGAFGLTKEGTGTLEYRGTAENFYTGATTVKSGKLYLARTGGSNRSIKGALVVGDGLGGLNADVVETDGTEPQIGNGVSVSIASSGLLRVGTTVQEAIGALSGEGRLVLEAPALQTSSFLNTKYSGNISGTGDLIKAGSGQLVLDGTNPFSGTARAVIGELIVDGSQSLSDVVVSSGATLGGSGVVGNVEVLAGGTIAPGHPVGSLRTRNLMFRPGSHLDVQLGGEPSAGNFDAISIVGGTVTNQGAILAVQMQPTAAPTNATVYAILQNGGVDLVQGIFQGQPNGSTLLANNGLKLRVNYNANAANDVTLTVTDLPIFPSLVELAGGNANHAIDPNECSLLNVSLFNPLGWTLSNVKAELKTSSPAVVVTQPDSGYPDIPASQRRNNLTPFQFSALPQFPCGTNVTFRLQVTTETNGQFTIPLVVHSGSPGPAVRFNKNLAAPIPDAGVLNSTLNVSGFTGHLSKVVVGLHIAHNQLNNLDISLIAPDGTQVPLSTDNGGTANDYGTGCPDAERTFFDPESSRLISSALSLPPYVGTFKPEGDLTVFQGRWETEVNGNWTLRIADDAAGGLGTLNCWSLLLHPATCTDGGGICESCNGPFVAAIDAGDQALTRRLDLTGSPSVCGVEKACPGLVGVVGSYRYDVHRFTNGVSPACVSVTLTPESGVALQSVAYRTSFDPSNPCLRYAADGGPAASTATTYRLQVAAGEVFEVVVQSAVSAASSEYRLSVDGFECPPPVLNIASTADPEKVRLSWSTAYPKHLLEGNPQVETGVWSNIPVVPAVVNGKFTVTNDATLDQRFFRLNKP